MTRPWLHSRSNSKACVTNAVRWDTWLETAQTGVTHGIQEAEVLGAIKEEEMVVEEEAVDMDGGSSKVNATTVAFVGMKLQIVGRTRVRMKHVECKEKQH